jgi:hypothetical protein
MDVMPMIPLFSGVDVILRTQTACAEPLMPLIKLVEEAPETEWAWSIECKTLMSSRLKGLTLQSFFQTNISTKLSSISSNNVE